MGKTVSAEKAVFGEWYRCEKYGVVRCVEEGNEESFPAFLVQSPSRSLKFFGEREIEHLPGGNAESMPEPKWLYKDGLYLCLHGQGNREKTMVSVQGDIVENVRDGLNVSGWAQRSTEMVLDNVSMDGRAYAKIQELAGVGGESLTAEADKPFEVGEWVRFSGEFWCVVSIPSAGRVELIGADAIYPYSCPVDDLGKLPKVGEWVDGPGRGNDYLLPVGTEFEIGCRGSKTTARVTKGKPDDEDCSNAKWIDKNLGESWVYDFANRKFRVTKYPPMPVVEAPKDDTPNPGPGHRLIDKEEDTPEEGDEYWNPVSGQWERCSGCFAPVADFNKQFDFRRRDYTQWQEPVPSSELYPLPVGSEIELKRPEGYVARLAVIIEPCGPNGGNAKWLSSHLTVDSPKYQWRVVKEASHEPLPGFRVGDWVRRADRQRLMRVVAVNAPYVTAEDATGARVSGRASGDATKFTKVTFRPFASAEEFKPHRDRWVQTVGTGDVGRVAGMGGDGVTVCLRPHDWSVLLSECVFDDDGTPCGVEVTQ